ncbi:MAG: hypothetical protein WC861_01205 [Candidatus Micrarchaeia archaeon]|jgi:hypothetical protein
MELAFSGMKHAPAPQGESKQAAAPLFFRKIFAPRQETQACVTDSWCAWVASVDPRYLPAQDQKAHAAAVEHVKTLNAGRKAGRFIGIAKYPFSALLASEVLLLGASYMFEAAPSVLFDAVKAVAVPLLILGACMYVAESARFNAKIKETLSNYSLHQIFIAKQAGKKGLN